MRKETQNKKEYLLNVLEEFRTIKDIKESFQLKYVF